MDSVYKDFEFGWADECEGGCSEPVFSREEEKYLRKKIEVVFWKVVSSDDTHFEMVEKCGCEKKYISETGRRLMDLIKKINHLIYYSNLSSRYEVDPVLKIFIQAARQYEDDYQLLLSAGQPSARQLVALGRHIVEIMREGCREWGVDDLKKRMDKGVYQRRASLYSYVDSLFNRHAKLLLVRVDLHYRKGLFVGREDLFSEDLARVKADWDDLYMELKNDFISNLVGHVAKIEYGVLKGFHVHVLLVFDGSKRRSDVWIADMIGRYWSDKVTHGAGYHFNCNSKKADYRYLGIGAIHRSQNEQRGHLYKYTLEYLVKSDIIISWLCPRERTYFRGWVKRPKRAQTASVNSVCRDFNGHVLI